LRHNNCQIFNISGGCSIIKENGKLIKKTTKKKFLKRKIINQYTNKKYFYAKDFKNITTKQLDKKFYLACENYKNKLSKIPIKTSWNLNFQIYKNLSLNASGKINNNDSRLLKEYSIVFNKTKKKNKNNYTTLKCHLDLKLFYGLLVKKYSNWNQPTSGTLILYERKPNKFDPNLLFSLNFLTV